MLNCNLRFSNKVLNEASVESETCVDRGSGRIETPPVGRVDDSSGTSQIETEINTSLGRGVSPL